VTRGVKWNEITVFVIEVEGWLMGDAMLPIAGRCGTQRPHAIRHISGRAAWLRYSPLGVSLVAGTPITTSIALRFCVRLTRMNRSTAMAVMPPPAGPGDGVHLEEGVKRTGRLDDRRRGGIGATQPKHWVMRAVAVST
jgi:hypothetical protein